MLTDGVTSAESISTCALAYRTLASNDTAFRARFGTGSSYTTSDGKTVTGLTSDSYFTIDLGQVCTVDSYKLYNYRYGRAYCMLESWKVVVFENGTDWIEVAYYSGNTFAVASGGRYNACVEERFEPTRARYVRLCAMGIYTGGETSASCDIRIPEFQIWGIEGTYGTKAPGTTTLKDNGFGVKAYGVSSDKLANAFDGNASTFTKLVFPNDALDVPFNVTSGDISGTDSITSYILTDLYEVTDVSGFDITFTANNTISGYYVLYTTDRTNWTAIRFDSLNAGAYSFVSDHSIRALAFAFTDSTEAEISEIDVF